MLFIVGTYKERNCIVGLKIYNSESKELGMFYRKQVFNTIQKDNITVAGIKAVTNNNGTEVKFMRGLYNVGKLDKVDSSGKPLDDKHMRIPIYTEGFKNDMRIVTVDSMGNLEKIDYKDLPDLIRQEKIIGIRQGRTLQLHPWCEVKGLV